MDFFVIVDSKVNKMLNQRDVSHTYIGTDLEAMSFAKNYSQWIVDMISPYFGKTVAEVGAGTGNLSELILKNAIDELTAFEPSIEMYERFCTKFPTQGKVKSFNSIFSKQSSDFQNYFDCILYINVLEHIEDDARELAYAYTSLKKGGYLCVFVPALSFLYSDFDRSIGHFRRYQKRQLSELIQHSKFTMLNIKYVDILGIVPWYLSLVVLKSTINKSNVSLYDNWVIPIVKIIETKIEPIIGKNLLVIAQKT